MPDSRQCGRSALLDKPPAPRHRTFSRTGKFALDVIVIEDRSVKSTPAAEQNPT